MTKATQRPTATSAQEISTMQSLTQQGAAWLMGLASSRTLRENTLVPRNGDGSYALKMSLRGWSRTEQITNCPTKRLRKALVVADQLAIGMDERTLDDIRRHLSKIANDYGIIALAAVMREILTSWNAMDLRPIPLYTTDEIRRRHAQQLTEELDALDRSTFDVSLVCDTCDQFRLGHKWIKGKAVPGYRVVKGCCPKCEEAA